MKKSKIGLWQPPQNVNNNHFENTWKIRSFRGNSSGPVAKLYARKAGPRRMCRPVYSLSNVSNRAANERVKNLIRPGEFCGIYISNKRWLDLTAYMIWSRHCLINQRRPSSLWIIEDRSWNASHQSCTFL